MREYRSHWPSYFCVLSPSTSMWNMKALRSTIQAGEANMPLKYSLNWLLRTYAHICVKYGVFMIKTVTRRTVYRWQCQWWWKSQPWRQNTMDSSWLHWLFSFYTKWVKKNKHNKQFLTSFVPLCNCLQRKQRTNPLMEVMKSEILVNEKW